MSSKDEVIDLQGDWVGEVHGVLQTRLSFLTLSHKRLSLLPQFSSSKMLKAFPNKDGVTSLGCL